MTDDKAMIRRGDVLAICQQAEIDEGPHSIAVWVSERVRALPAVTPRPMGEAPRDDFDLLIADAREAAEKAMVRFPQPNYVISKIAEEAGEVVKAAIHCAEGRETAENLRGEMVQTIAMLYRLWMEGDGVHGLPAVRSAPLAVPEDAPRDRGKMVRPKPGDRCGGYATEGGSDA
jgi:hypothetical protein